MTLTGAKMKEAGEKMNIKRTYSSPVCEIIIFDYREHVTASGDGASGSWDSGGGASGSWDNGGGATGSWDNGGGASGSWDNGGGASGSWAKGGGASGSW